MESHKGEREKERIRATAFREKVYSRRRRTTEVHERLRDGRQEGKGVKTEKRKRDARTHTYYEDGTRAEVRTGSLRE